MDTRKMFGISSSREVANQLIDSFSSEWCCVEMLSTWLDKTIEIKEVWAFPNSLELPLLALFLFKCCRDSRFPRERPYVLIKPLQQTDNDVSDFKITSK
jgi:hypothetical protein